MLNQRRLQLRCSTADFPKITTARRIKITLAHVGKIITVSFGTKKRRVSPLENSPPIPAVTSISPTAVIPIPACLASTLSPIKRLIRMPIARPAEVIDSSNLLANNGLSMPSPCAAFTPLIIAIGVAIIPPKRAQCATASRDSGPFFRRHS